METKKRILIVEDEKNISRLMEYNIKKEGYDCTCVFDGESGLAEALTGRYDLILLDIMLPRMNGFEICEKVRLVSQVPIIFVTAREEEKDKVLGLDTGADDYVTKPFSHRELLSRIRANIRRSAAEVVTDRQQDAGDVIQIGELTIDSTHYSVTKNGEPIELSKKDYDFIAFLAAHVGQAYSRESLLETIWGYEGFLGDIRTVDVTVHRIRNKIEKDPARPEYLLTKRGVGYFLAKR